MAGNHIVTPVTYTKVLFVLMLLMVATIAVAKIEAIAVNPTVDLLAALAIATAKTIFVLLIFMHVKYSSNLAKMFAGAGFFWLMILLVLIFADYATRTWHSPFGVGWE